MAYGAESARLEALQQSFGQGTQRAERDVPQMTAAAQKPGGKAIKGAEKVAAGGKALRGKILGGKGKGGKPPTGGGAGAG